MNKFVEVDGNWKRFNEAKPNDKILLLHATSYEVAKKILDEGFNTNERNWLDSEEGYIYLSGSKYTLGTYLRHNENAIVRVIVQKKNLLPDNNSVDWKEYVRLNKNELKKDNVLIKNPTANDTFKYIGQVKARVEDIEVLDIIKA